MGCTVLARCRDWPNGARWVVAVYTGIRQGEALALTWRDVQLADPASLTVRLSAARVRGERVVKKPKSKKVSFEDAFQKVQQDQETADDRFKEAFMKEKDRLKVTEKKFEENMKRKDELEMPIKPIDLD